MCRVQKWPPTHLHQTTHYSTSCKASTPRNTSDSATLGPIDRLTTRQQISIIRLTSDFTHQNRTQLRAQKTTQRILFKETKKSTFRNSRFAVEQVDHQQGCDTQQTTPGKFCRCIADGAPRARFEHNEHSSLLLQLLRWTHHQKSITPNSQRNSSSTTSDNERQHPAARRAGAHTFAMSLRRFHLGASSHQLDITRY